MATDNQKAFPSLHDTFDRYRGMDLRDYFAATALPVALRFAEADHRVTSDNIAEVAAAAAYGVADAMMAERDRER